MWVITLGLFNSGQDCCEALGLCSNRVLTFVSFLGKSSDLCDVIRLLLTPEIERRPSAAEILALPSVVNVWRWRRKYVAYSQIVSKLVFRVLLITLVHFF